MSAELLVEPGAATLYASIFELLTRYSIALTLGLALVLCLRPIWQRSFGARASLALWWSVPLALILASLPAPQRSLLDERWSAASSPAAAQFVRAAEPNSAATGNYSPQPPQLASTDSLSPANPVNGPVAESFPDLSTILVIIWAFGALLCGLVLAFQQARFVRSLGPLSPRGDGLYVASGSLMSPVLLGLLRPRIVLPADFTQRFSAEQQALVLAHEHWHLHRLDLWAGLAASVLRCLFWFHPLLPLAQRWFRLDQELACDEAVLSQVPERRGDYARALLESQLAATGLPVGCFWQSSQPLKTRIVMISKPFPALIRTRLGSSIAALTACSVLSLAWAAQPSSVAEPALTPIAIAPPAPTPNSTLLTPATAPVVATTATRATSASAPVVVAADTAAARPASAPVVAPEPAAAARPQAVAPVDQPAPAPSPLALPAMTRSGLPASTTVLLASAEPSPQPSADITVLSPPILISEVQPRWPSLFRGFRSKQVSDAEVKVEFTVDTDGRARDLVLSASGAGPMNPRFEKAAHTAMQQWKFSPATRDGEPVPYRTETVIQFRLSNAFSLTDNIDPVGPPRNHYRRFAIPPSSQKYQ